MPASGKEGTTTAKKKEEQHGIDRKAALRMLAERLKAGDKLDHVIKLKDCTTPAKDLKEKRKLLKAEKHWTVRNDTIQYKDGMILNYIASWGRWVVIHYNGKTYSGRVLKVDCAGMRTYYYVPLRHVDKLTALEGIDLNERQRQLLLRMANDLGIPIKKKPWLATLEHPAHNGMKQNLASWQNRAFESEKLKDLLARQPWLWDILLPVVTVNLLPLLEHPERMPTFAENLVPASREDHEVMMQALRAVTFVNDTGLIDAGPISAGSNLKPLKHSPERFTLINGTAGSIRSIINELSERDRRLKCGDSVPVQPAVPVLLSRAVIFSDFVINHPIPAGLQRLTEKEQDLLRTAMAHFLIKEHAKWVINEFEELSSSPESYRISRTWHWYSVLLCGMSLAWFPDVWNDIVQQAGQRLKGEKNRLNDERRIIEEAIDFLSHPSRYADRLIEKPDSHDKANKLLEEYDGFQFVLTKGKLKGIPLTGFREKTLLRLLKWENGEESRLEQLLSTCEQRGILLNRSHNLSFKVGSNLRLVIFHFGEEGGDQPG